MTEEQVVDITREALFLIIECSAPLLLISLVVGLVISIFQTITSSQYISDSYVNSGADTYICSENNRCFYRCYDFRLMDSDKGN